MYVGGHSDTLGGALAGSRELVETVFRKGYMLMGAAMAPFDAWLLLRGLMTLPARLAQQQADALALACWLADHPKVRRVFHPAFAEGAQGQLFARQMRGHSGLFSAEFDLPDHAATLACGNRLELFGKAISWGGVESLVTSPYRSDPGPDHEGRMPRTALRFSVGLEGAEALIADLERALG
jgi:cystathionine beta-lyase/cystathionine gamma-synthase